FFYSSRRRHTRFSRDWSSDVCSSDLIEVILVDDGSTDRTLEIANEFKDYLKIISQENSGNCSFPRNRGLKEAKGKYISFLDADRSEERRVGKDGISRWTLQNYQKTPA